MPQSVTGELTKTRHLIRQGWDEVALEYAKDRLGVFGRFAERLLDLLQPSPGDVLLDVGCGSGAVALKAAAWIGSPGWVTGCDISSALVSWAEQTAQEQEIANISFHQMDAESLDFPDDSFDIVVCAFSLFQFPNVDIALNEMRRVLKPGGKLGLSNWGPGFFSPIATLQRDLFRAFGIKPLLTNPIVFKPDVLQSLLEEAGFNAIELIAEEEDVWAKDPAQIWAFNLDMGPFPVMLQQQLSTEERVQLEQQFIDILEKLITENGIKCVFHPLYALAEKDR